MDRDEVTKSENAVAGTRLPLGQQDKALAELYDTVSQLTARLDPIMTPLPEKDIAEPSNDKMKLQSPIAAQIEENNQSIFRTSSKLRMIMERLEC